MKILATSDIHGSKSLIYILSEIVKKENIDAVIIAGDIAPKGFYQLYKNGPEYYIRSAFGLRNREKILKGNKRQIKTKLDLFGFVELPDHNYNISIIKSKQKEKLRQICRLLNAIDIPVYMLIGNDDHIPDKDWDGILNDYGIFNLNLMRTASSNGANLRTYDLGELKIAGFQYVLPTPWNTNNELPEDELVKKLKYIEGQVDRKTILITHGPPKGILDRVANGLRAGSESLFNLVKDKQPVFHVFGHIHEAFGNAKINNTICCNVSCLWSEWIFRGYIIDTENESLKRIEGELR